MKRLDNSFAILTGPRHASVLFLFGLIVFVRMANNSHAQDWPVHHAPAAGPVPQYIPAYPLGDKPDINRSTTPSLPPLAILPPRTIPAPRTILAPRTIPGPGETPSETMHESNQPVDSRPSPPPLDPGTEYEVSPRNGIHEKDNAVGFSPTAQPIRQCDPPKRCVCPTGASTSWWQAGVRGRPYVEALDLGCQCGKENPGLNPNFSAQWPRPFSAILDERFPDQARRRYSNCAQSDRWIDRFDSLASFKLINYHRSDNGYWGRGADPYGCLGESRR